MRKFDPTKARSSWRLVRPEMSVIVEAMITTNPSHQNGLVHAGPGRSGRTFLDSIKTTRSRGTTAIHRYFAHFSERSCTEPSVLSVRYVAPWAASMTTARTATDTVYQSSNPTCPRTLKSVKNAIEKFPCGSSGTPRATLPAAAPKRIASKKLEQTKMKSQYACQRRSLMCPPTSSEIPRKIRHHKIKKSAR